MYKLGPLRGKRKKFCPKCKKKDVELAESLFGQLKMLEESCRSLNAKKSVQSQNKIRNTEVMAMYIIKSKVVFLQKMKGTGQKMDGKSFSM